MYCKKCGSQIENDQRFCHICGFELTPRSEKKAEYCKMCGTLLEDGQSVCRVCGFGETAQSEKPKAYCKKCGAPLEDGQSVCRVCGLELNPQNVISFTGAKSESAPKAAETAGAEGSPVGAANVGDSAENTAANTDEKTAVGGSQADFAPSEKTNAYRESLRYRYQDKYRGMPMAWYKFVTYFWLPLNAALSAYLAIAMFIGAFNGASDSAFRAVILTFYAIFLILTCVKLAKMKIVGINLWYANYGINIILSLFMSNIAGIISIAGIFAVNVQYFSKREFLFSNGAAENDNE